LLVSELVDLKPDQVMRLDGWNDLWAPANVLQPDMLMDPGDAAMANAGTGT
jgi:hypothetical protein